MMKTDNIVNRINILLHDGVQTNSALKRKHVADSENKLPEILFITSYPPRECGIATYSQDLIKALNNKFDRSFEIKVCALESVDEQHKYTDEVKYILNTDAPNAFTDLAKTINEDDVLMVMIQHEFGFFENKEEDFKQFLQALTKPVVLVFHTVLPDPNDSLKIKVQEISGMVKSIIVMTRSSAKILDKDYDIPKEKIKIIPHGTHLVPHSDKELLKVKYNLSGKKVLSTFGLLSSGKSIETSLRALPAIIEKNSDTMFLIIGKTHPSVVKREGYKYRNMLDAIVMELGLQEHVQYVNYYLPLPELLEYLQLTDVYLFTSKDRHQAVSGTFSYALSCGCPIVSTPIPHAIEVLRNEAGIIFDFENSEQLSVEVNRLLGDEKLRKDISLNGIHRIVSTAWENAAIAHAMLFEKIIGDEILLRYSVPEINLDHFKKLTTNFGMIQFSKINQPDIASGYTLDDNARAMIAMCKHFKLTKDETDLEYINIYFHFIKYCLRPNGQFLNYVSELKKFTEQNNSTNLEDSNGRAVWALGYLISMKSILPKKLITDAEEIMQIVLQNVNKIHSTRAMAFIIKGLYFYNKNNKSIRNISLIKEFANRLLQMYRHEADAEWNWFESYLTYANSILPEAMLCAWLATGELVYKETAKSSFDFLLLKIFGKNRISVISNKGWLYKDKESVPVTIGGEQPIDIAYTILALHKFHQVFAETAYIKKMKIAFNWFLGNNHLHQIIYNPCTGGCYDGLEDNYINLNQGAESTVSYLLARLTVEENLNADKKIRCSKSDQLKIYGGNKFPELID